MESPVARKPKARREPLRLKSRRSPNKIPSHESEGWKVMSRESQRVGVNLSGKRAEETCASPHEQSRRQRCAYLKQEAGGAKTPLTVILPASRAKRGVALRKTDTRTTPVTMNEPKPVCDLARAKRRWRFATAHPCTAEGQTGNQHTSITNKKLQLRLLH